MVLYADSAALEGHNAYVNPLDGKNLNRGWPGKPDATLTERIAHKITTEFIERSDAVIDVHGGEWDEDIDCFIITHRTGDATRRAILDAAHHLFLEKGYAATSIEAIAEHAQVARQTVYDAFGDRTSLLYGHPPQQRLVSGLGEVEMAVHRHLPGTPFSALPVLFRKPKTTATRYRPAN